MKSKLMTILWAGALMFSITAPNAMATSPNARPAGSAVTRSASAKTSVAKNAVTRSKAVTRVSPRAAVPPHTILPGAKHNF